MKRIHFYLITFIIVLGCKSSYRCQSLGLKKEFWKDCSELRVSPLQNSLDKWPIRIDNSPTNRREFYSHSHQILKDSTFIGYTVDCIENLLGPAESYFDPSNVSDTTTNIDKDYTFMSKKEAKIVYELYHSTNRDLNRDSSIHFNIFYNKKNRRIYKTRLDIGEDPFFHRNQNFELDSACISLLEKLYYQRNRWRPKALADSSPNAYRRHFPLRSIGDDYHKLTLPCIEEKFGKANQYYYSYIPHYGMISVNYVFEGAYYTMGIKFVFSMKDLRCIRRLSIPFI